MAANKHPKAFFIGTTLVIGFLWILGLSGCPKRPAVFTAVPVPHIQNAQELIRAVHERGQTIKSLRATGSMVMRRGSKRLKAHTVILSKRPAFLRFETSSFFDQPLSILVTDGMRFSLWEMETGRFFEGPATPANISRVIPIPLDGPEVVGIVLGDPPLIPFVQAGLDWDKNDELYHLTVSNSSLSQEIWIHPQRLRPTRVESRDRGQLLYRLSYEDWIGKTQQSQVPQKILFEMPAEDIWLKMNIKEVDLNGLLEDALFSLEPPVGISVESLDQNPSSDLSPNPESTKPDSQ